MKLLFDRDGLLDALAVLAGAVAARDLRGGTVLQHALVRHAPGDEFARFYAHDHDLGVTLGVRVGERAEPGVALVPCAVFTQALRAAPAGDVGVAAAGGLTTLACGGAEYRVPTPDPGEYPEPPAADGFDLDAGAAELQAALGFAGGAVPRGDRQFRHQAMAGVLVDSDGGRLTLVGTDSKQLAVAPLAPFTAPSGWHRVGQWVLPLRAARLLGSLLGRPDTPARVGVALGAGRAAFGGGDRWRLRCQLLEGVYPPYRTILPKARAASVATLAADGLRRAVKQAAVMAADEHRRVEFAFAPGSLTLTAESAGAGRARVRVACDFAGDPVSVLLDPALTLDAIDAAGDGPVEIHCDSAYRGVVFRPPGGSGETPLGLVMPMSK